MPQAPRDDVVFIGIQVDQSNEKEIKIRIVERYEILMKNLGV